MTHRRIERQVGSPWRIRIAVGLLAAWCSLLSAQATASETQAEALARLDGLIMTLKEIRSKTRTQDTLESALEGSVSRYSCARFWVMGIVEGAAGVDGAAYVKAKMGFNLPLPIGWITTYALDNGTPLYIGAEAKGTTAMALDVMGGFENWNCWPEESFFPNPDLYDIAAYESDYVHDLPQGSNQSLRTAAQSSQGASSPGTAAAIDMLNGLVSTLRQVGLDPSDPQVVHRVLANGGLDAIDELVDLAGAGKSVPERALGASEDLINLLYEHAPDATVVSQVSNYLATDWTAMDPCSMLPLFWEVCDTAQTFKDAMVTAFGALRDLPDLVGPLESQLDQMNGIGATGLIGSWAGEFTTPLSGLGGEFQNMSDTIDNIVSTANIINHVDFADKMNSLIDSVGATMDLLPSLLDEMVDNFTQTYSVSVTEYFSLPGASGMCVAQLSDVSAANPKVPTLYCNVW